MTRERLALLAFSGFLGLVIYTADVGAGDRYWGWLKIVPMGDKVCHFLFMFTFSCLANLAMGCRSAGKRLRGLLWGTLIVAAIVVGEEFSQIWIPGRSFDLLDLSADLIGIVGGDLLARRLMTRGSHSLGLGANAPEPLISFAARSAIEPGPSDQVSVQDR